MSVRVLAMVLSSDGPYLRMVNAVRRTWGQDSRDDFKVLYHYARRAGYPSPPPGGVIQRGDVLVADLPEGLNSLLQQTLMAYDYVRRTESFDYVFRCCCGSYVDRDRLLAWVEDKPRERFYAGKKGPYQGSEWLYASGSGYFLSADLVTLLADHADEVMAYPNSHAYDDVSVGHFLADQGVVVTDAPRVDGAVEAVPGAYHWHFETREEKFDALHALLGKTPHA